MGREVRIVPADWQHPKNARGNYMPLLEGPWSKHVAEWDLAAAKWAEGFEEDFSDWKPDAPVKWKLRDADTLKYALYSDYAGSRPRKKDYMPEFAPGTANHLMMYEDCTEGTPISPSFATPEELAHWLADNNASACGREGATYEQWLRVCQGGYAPSMVLDANGLRSGVAL